MGLQRMTRMRGQAIVVRDMSQPMGIVSLNWVNFAVPMLLTKFALALTFFSRIRRFDVHE
jgi:hypothetical protein